MTNHEERLLIELKSEDDSIVVNAAAVLAREIMIPDGRFNEAEAILLETVGKETSKDGRLLEFILAQLYLKNNEIPRALRFLVLAKTSQIESIRNAANEILESYPGI